MKEIILETLIDSAKLIPFLFLTFLLLEFIEHKATSKSKKLIEKAGRFGPIIGSLLGAFPQCGFSVSATNFYATRVISIGTLISIYLSTSDEMLPILISEGASIGIILKIIGLKVLVGMIFGFICDYIFRKNDHNTNNEIKDFCHDEHCNCHHGIIKPAIKHTIKTIIFIMLISFFLNFGIDYLGKENISKLFMKNSVFGPFIASLIGLIPNCAASVVITELLLSNIISFGSAMAGLLTGSGVALILLFKINKNIKENIKILLTVYGVGVIIGLLIDIIGLTF